MSLARLAFLQRRQPVHHLHRLQAHGDDALEQVQDVFWVVVFARPIVRVVHDLRPELHGRGLGSQLLKHGEDEARRLGARRLILAVNKRNARAITAYQRNGFGVVESVMADIGVGFVMDDFIMAKDLFAVSATVAPSGSKP